MKPLEGPAAIRARAARIVADVNARGKSLDALFAQIEGTPQERGLLRVLAYGTVRWQIRLEAFLEKLSSRPQRDLDTDLRGLLLVGLFQLLHTDIAAHAAVSETVEAARRLKQSRAASFINAVLRRCQREAKNLAAELDTDLGVRTAHPAWLVEMLRHDWPDSYASILDANNAHPSFWLRINKRRTDVETYLNRLRTSGFQASRSEYAPEALLLDTPVDVRRLPGFEEGDLSIQDAAAQLAARLLAPQSGDRVLDACAAPGGKACHLLELYPHMRELIAVDSSAERLRKVRENLDRLRLEATLITGDATNPKVWWDGRPFERILLDVPCSATGVIRRHPDIKLLRRAGDIAEFGKVQMEILNRIWPLLAIGGRLVYASCSALRAETIEVVANFLIKHPDARDATATACQMAGAPLPRHAPGLTIHAGESQMDGFYYACLTKQ
jgi:16S rRNA (cytosine967-C5)-methyltransferase